MGITKKERLALFEKAGGRCECRSNRCRHHAPGERCTQELGDGWDAYYMRGSNGTGADNLVAFCAICYKNIMGAWEDDHREMIERMKAIRKSMSRTSQ
jgi:hypothetical protein